MPKFLEKALRKEYGDNDNAVYGTLNSIGAMRGSRETPKGRAMQRKHDEDSKRPMAARIGAKRRG